MKRPAKPGRLFLVGAGPGDLGLLTGRGNELLRQADVVIYDRLVNPALLELTRRSCLKIYAGKEADEKGKGQTRIHQQMVQKAKQGKTVIRLKGGDPTVFGRITEELKVLNRSRIPFEIVPGVSSVWAAAAAAGIPLTDRTLSSSVAIVTGHEAVGKRTGVQWQALARSTDTLVILMGWSKLPQILKQLRKALPASTPVALLRWVSTPAQEQLISTLGKIQQEIKRRPDLGPPVVAIVGRVVGLSRSGKSQPLKGKSIVVTRPAGDQAGLTSRLKALGAHCQHLPTIAIRARKLPVAQAKALVQALPRYDWVLFTSHHGVDGLVRLVSQRGKRFRSVVKGKICAIGPRTAQSVRAADREPDLIPDEFSKEGIEKTFDQIPVKGKRILIPRSNLGMGDRLAKVLRKRGAHVDESVLYETLPVKISVDRIKKALKKADAVTFTSASTARVFLESMQQAKLSAKAFQGVVPVAIGPATAKVLKAGGVRRVKMPKRSWTIDGLVEAIVETVS